MMIKNRQALNKKRLPGSVVSDPDSGCWLWRGQISNSGYECPPGKLFDIFRANTRGHHHQAKLW